MKLTHESRNKIMTSGCSWTEGINPNQNWPDILSDKLRKENSNYGMSGAGNQYIYNQVVDNYNNEDLICVLWTGFDRWDFEDLNGRKTISMTNKHPKEVWDSLTEANFMEPLFNLKRNFRYIHGFQNFCEANKIKDIHALAFTDYNPWTPSWAPTGSRVADSGNRTRYLKEFIDYNIHDYINDDHFIGWPCFKEMQGYTMSNHLQDAEPDQKGWRSNPKFRISSTDWHPNKEGHSIIANLFYDRYIELYGNPAS